MEWRNLTASEIAATDRNLPVLLPLAATEQHGPHLPVSTDAIIAEHLCRAIDARMPDELLVLPAVTVTCSRHHLELGGTLTVTHRTFMAYVEEILESVVANGFRTLVLFNSHGGNQAIAQVIVEDFGMSHPESVIALITWWRAAGERLARITTTGPGGVGHACEFETSLIEVAAPSLVRRDRIEKGGNIPTFDWAESDMIRGASALLHRPIKAMTRNGTFGDPTASSAEKGRAITEAVADACERILRDLRLRGASKRP